MKAVIYARFSSHNQRDESIDGQVRVCTQFAKQHGMTIVEIYADRALTGKTDARPEFQRMIKDSSKKNFEAVLCYAVDRFARNREDSAIYKSRLKKNGVKVFYATSPLNDTPESILMEAVMEGLAEYYSENLARSIKRGLVENSLECKVIGGTTPLGYRIGKDHKYEIEPVGAKLVQMIYELYADGHTTKEICDILNGMGVKSSRGAAFNKNSLRVILKNRKYIGEYSAMGNTVPNGIPRIISDELFERVQSRVEVVTRSKGHTKAKEDYLLTTKLFCGQCGQPMIGESGTSKSGTMHYYYKCAGRKKEHSCNKKVEKKDLIESIVVQQVVNRALTDEMIDLVSSRVVELFEKEAADHSLLDSYKDRLKEVEKGLKNLLNAIEQGIISATTKDRLTALEEEKETLLYNISTEEQSKPIIKKSEIMFWLDSFRHGDVSNPEYRRRVIDALVRRVEVFDNPDGSRTFTFYCYTMPDSFVYTLECSDIARPSPPLRPHPNTFITKYLFGFTVRIEMI